jgi:hypothetical protein
MRLLPHSYLCCSHLLVRIARPIGVECESAELRRRTEIDGRTAIVWRKATAPFGKVQGARRLRVRLAGGNGAVAQLTNAIK